MRSLLASAIRGGPARGKWSVVWLLTLVGAVASGTSIFVPALRNWCILICVAIALAAFWLHARGSYAFAEKSRGTRPDVSLATLLPSIAVFVAGFAPGYLLNRFALAVPSSLALLWAFLLWRRDGTRDPGRLIMMALLLGALIVGAVVYANVKLDRSSPRTFTAEVADRAVRSGKNGNTYSLALRPWGPREEMEWERVSREMYDRVQPGARVRVELHPGALGMPWFTIATQ